MGIEGEIDLLNPSSYVATLQRERQCGKRPHLRRQTGLSAVGSTCCRRGDSMGWLVLLDPQENEIHAHLGGFWIPVY